MSQQRKFHVFLSIFAVIFFLSCEPETKINSPSISASDLSFSKDSLILAQKYRKRGEQFRNSNNMDSAIYFATKAFEVVERNRGLQPFAKDIYFLKSQSCWNERKYIQGHYSVNQAILAALEQENIDSLFIARCLSLKGRHYSKQKRDSLALIKFNQSIEIGERWGGNKPIRQEFYKHLLVHYLQRQDSLNFFSNLQFVKSRWPNKDDLEFIFS